MPGEEVEEVPLGHEGDEAAVRRQVGKVGDRHRRAADVAGELPYLLVGALEEVLQEPQLVHHLQGRGVDGIAAEVAQEVGVLLQDEDVHPGTSEEEAEHHAGRPAPRDTAADVHRLGRAAGVSWHVRPLPCDHGVTPFSLKHPHHPG